MEIKITTQHMLKILYYLSWIIFIGLCIEAGSFLFNGIYTLSINTYNARYLGLLDLHEFDPVYYLNEILFISIVAVLKAILFYLIVKLLHEKKVNMVQPFNPEMGRFLFHITYLTFGIGLFIYWAVNFNKWIMSNNVKMPAPEILHLEGADVWFFMSVILFVIAQIFKRGIEIQSENELTI